VGKSEEMGVEIRHKLQDKPTRRFLGTWILKKLRSLSKSATFSLRKWEEGK